MSPRPRDYALNLSKESNGIDPSSLGKVNLSDLVRIVKSCDCACFCNLVTEGDWQLIKNTWNFI